MGNENEKATGLKDNEVGQSDVHPVVKCPVCKGHGYRFDRSQCAVCAGSGKLTAPKEVHEMKFRKFDRKSIFYKEGI